MRPQVISDGVNGLQPVEELDAEKIIKWIMEALEVTEEINFTINAEGKVDRAFFLHLQSAAMAAYPHRIEGFWEDICRIGDAVVHSFDLTVEKEWPLKCWIQIGHFLDDLQKYCKTGLFTMVSGVISASLSKKMIAVPDFNANKDITDSMLLYWNCGSAVTVAMAKESQKKRKISKDLMSLYMHATDTFFELIGTNLIFCTDAFFKLTAQILTKGMIYNDDAMTRKYVDALHFALASDEPVTKAKMVSFLQRLPVRKGLVELIAFEKDTHVQKSILKILKAMLEYCRDKKIPFEIDWTEVFVHVLYWHKDAVDLLVLQAEDTEQDEETSGCNLVEMVVKIYLRHTDNIDKLPAQQLEHESVKRLTNLIKAHVDFMTCEKLFYLLRKHVADSPRMCAVIILFIDVSAQAISGEPQFQEEYTTLIKTVFRQIDVVKPYPELVSRLIKIFDISAAKRDDGFKKKIMSIVPEAILRCDQYGTAVDLLEVLKAIGFEVDELMDLFENLLEQVGGGIRPIRTLLSILALHDVLDIFKVLDSTDRRTVYDFFKKKIGTRYDNGILSVSLMVHMLAAFHSTPERFPGEASNVIETEASLIHQYISERIIRAETLSFAATHLSISACVLYTAFLGDGTNLFYAFCAVGQNSIAFRLNYELDRERNAAINDLCLLRKFWRSAIDVFKEFVPVNVVPSVLFELYPRIEVNLVDQAEKFLSTILKYDNDEPENQYQLFAWSVHYLVVQLKPRDVNPIVNKLFKFIVRTESVACACAIASKIFLLNLRLFSERSSRLKGVCDVQKNLFKNHLMDQGDSHRKRLMDLLNDAPDGVPRRQLQELRKILQEGPMGEAPQRENDSNGDEVSDEGLSGDQEIDKGIDGDEGMDDERTTDHSARSDGSLPRLNQSVLLSHPY